MKVMTLGSGFVADHLPYEQIKDDNMAYCPIPYCPIPYRLTPNQEDIDWCLSKDKPDVIINCLGRTGRPNVDWCESHKTETYESNVVLPLMIAEWCEKHSVRLIQMGSGCIYFGESTHCHWVQGDGKPMPDIGPNTTAWTVTLPGKRIEDGWREEDMANPQSFYSKTKYACDMMIGSLPHVTTLRLRMPITSKNNSRNLINKLRGYKQIIDIPNSVTFLNDLTRCVDWVIQKDLRGIYHVANPEPLTATRIMREWQKYHPEHTFEIISEFQLDQITKAKRSNCILDTMKLTNTGFNMTPTEEALEKCMFEYAKNCTQETHV